MNRRQHTRSRMLNRRTINQSWNRGNSSDGIEAGGILETSPAMNASLLGRTKPCIFRLSLTASLTHWVDYRLIYFAALRDVKLAGKITLTVNAQRSVPRLDRKLQGSTNPPGPIQPCLEKRSVIFYQGVSRCGDNLLFSLHHARIWRPSTHGG